MAGAAAGPSLSSRVHAVDRFYNSPPVDTLGTSGSRRPCPVAGNLDRFLESTAPVVAVQDSPKRRGKGLRDCEGGELNPYFCLGDLWDSFKEWSAYGAGVPLVLNGSDSVVQYYVPYISAIQLFTDAQRPVSGFRHPGEDSVGDTYRDTHSVGSSKGDADKAREGTAGTSVSNFQVGLEGEQKLLPVFEYLERDPPYGREPLADKISTLTSKFPELKTYRSCNLLPSSWMSVAWYPIYRIPTGPTLKDLDACFLTYHLLSTQKFNSGPHSHIPGTPTVSNLKFANAMPNRLTLPAFGLASYKFRGSIWTSNGVQERQLAGTLLQAADNWLRLLRVDHPDYRFFISHYNGFKR